MHELLPSICRTSSLDLVERRMRIRCWRNHVANEIMSRMNDVTNESITNESWHERIMSRMNYVTNELCHEWIMSRMNYVTNELCYEWIMSRMNYVLTNEYASSICRIHKGSTRRNGAWGFDDEWIMIRKDDVTNELCHEWINYEWIMARMNFSRMNQSRMNYVTNEYVSSIHINISIYMYVYIYMCHEGSTRWNFGWGLDMNESCHGWMMSRMNTYHAYAGIIKSRPGGTAREIRWWVNHVTNELYHDWINLDWINYDWINYEWIMSRMNDVANEYVSSMRRNYEVSTRRNSTRGLGSG